MNAYEDIPDDVVTYPKGAVNKRGYPAHSGRVRYIDPESTNTNYAGLNQGIGDHTSPAIDIPTRFSDNGKWAGPGYEFRVLEARGTTAWNTGSMVRVQLRNGDQLLFGHLTSISKEIKFAVGKDMFLPAHTFIGRTDAIIGYASGPHLHVQGIYRNGVEISVRDLNRYLRGY